MLFDLTEYFKYPMMLEQSSSHQKWDIMSIFQDVYDQVQGELLAIFYILKHPDLKSFNLEQCLYLLIYESLQPLVTPMTVNVGNIYCPLLIFHLFPVTIVLF